MDTHSLQCKLIYYILSDLKIVHDETFSPFVHRVLWYLSLRTAYGLVLPCVLRTFKQLTYSVFYFIHVKNQTKVPFVACKSKLLTSNVGVLRLPYLDPSVLFCCIY